MRGSLGSWGALGVSAAALLKQHTGSHCSPQPIHKCEMKRCAVAALLLAWLALSSAANVAAPAIVGGHDATGGPARFPYIAGLYESASDAKPFCDGELALPLSWGHCGLLEFHPNAPRCTTLQTRPPAACRRADRGQPGPHCCHRRSREQPGQVGCNSIQLDRVLNGLSPPTMRRPCSACSTATTKRMCAPPAQTPRWAGIAAGGGARRQLGVQQALRARLSDLATRAQPRGCTRPTCPNPEDVRPALRLPGPPPEGPDWRLRPDPEPRRAV